MNSKSINENEDASKNDSVSEAESKASVDPSTEDKESGQPTSRKVPGINWIVAWLVMVGAVVFLHYAAEPIEDRLPVIDQAVRNLITFMAILGIPFTFFIWFSFFSDNGTLLIRQALFWGYVLLEVAVVSIMVSFVEFDGDLVPIGWKAERKFETAANSTLVDLKKETPEDFPQFLGPNRDGKLPGLFLAYDWEKDKPVLKWKQPIGEGHSGFATRNGYAVTMEQRGPQEMTTCYEIETGKLMWTYGIETRHDTLFGKPGPRSTPTIHGGMVYSLGAHGHLACLDGSNGKPVWTKDLLKEFGTNLEKEGQAVTWGRAGSPLVVDNKVVVPAGGPPEGPFVSLVCYDRLTGDEIWRGGETQIGYSSPILMGFPKPGNRNARAVVSVNENNVTAHDLDNGTVVWEWVRPGNSNADANTSQPVVLPGSNLLLTKGYGLGAERIQIQGNQLQSLWKNTAVLKTKFTNAVYYNTYGFALSDGRLECIDLRNGRRVWKSRNSYGHGQLLLCGSELLVLSEKGYLALVRAWGSTEEEDTKRKHVQFTSMQVLEGTTWNTIAMHGNLMLVRNSKEAACYEMPVRFQN